MLHINIESKEDEDTLEELTWEKSKNRKKHCIMFDYKKIYIFCKCVRLDTTV